MTAVVTETPLAMQKEEEENIKKKKKSWPRLTIMEIDSTHFTAAIKEVVPLHLQIWLCEASVCWLTFNSLHHVRHF